MHLKEDSTHGLKFPPVLPCLGGQRPYRPGRICHDDKGLSVCIWQRERLRGINLDLPPLRSGYHRAWDGWHATSHLRALAESFLYKRGRFPTGCQHEQASTWGVNPTEPMEARRPNSLYGERRCGHSSRWRHAHPGSEGKPRTGPRTTACRTFRSTLAECEHG
jgi:hypothetical protein